MQKEILIPRQLSYQWKICLLEQDGDTPVIGAVSQLEPYQLAQLAFFLGKTPKVTIISQDGFERSFLEDTGDATEALFDEDEEISLGALGPVDLLEETEGEGTLLRQLHQLLLDAVRQGASDIHFEPQLEHFVVRFRIDGVLTQRLQLPLKAQSQVIARLKVLSMLDVTERRLPQDGRLELKISNRSVDFRISTVPVLGGERVVLRILDGARSVPDLPKLGMQETSLLRWQELLEKREGLLLVTGPTGSGKTTTLYSALSKLSKQTCNLMTIEDPVEVRLEKISQINVAPKLGLTFAKGLRHILRQDPDVILVGEIRDQETAEIAIEASLTGHLVLSTLHTNDALSAPIRLLDMGIESYLINSSLLGVVAQRLLRKLCPHCKQEHALTTAEKEIWIQSAMQFAGNLECIVPEQVFHPVGCNKCYGIGYSGRIGVFEVLPFTEELQTAFAKKADRSEMAQIARSQKVVQMSDEAKELIAMGMTSLEEVKRVLG